MTFEQHGFELILHRFFFINKYYTIPGWVDLQLAESVDTEPQIRRNYEYIGPIIKFPVSF